MKGLHSFTIPAYHQREELLPTKAPILFPQNTGVNFASLRPSPVACDSDRAASDGSPVFPRLHENHNLKDFAVKTAEEVFFGTAWALS